ncbi:unnamed protein product [Rotaria sordida]|uniref:Uncharacterized protein n=1 Tax=Rotaria sordida TaxID=392033 RepID=A0A818S3F6_9BILA|nr:unnamed protein product [Rotaria sordida]CAF0970906.1 unnamed protein product [Rotaria sordida]CAF0999425.1 unnamed protein product [Rotaria sordida]CAF3588270.1 unnamed protein product [Rotaria sordida]CAF3607191.1 unnamed protein product [Rotaria sordida]
MTSATALASSISSTTGRRLHYQSQISNTSLSLNQNFSIGEPSNLNESFSSSTIPINPLVTIVYSNASLLQENQQLLLNSYASCRRLLDHMKQVVGIPQDETIDLMDNEGKVKELNTHFDDYATQFLTARSTYYVLKVEGKLNHYSCKFILYFILKKKPIPVDSQTGEKRYTPSFNLDQIDQKLGTILTNSLNTLNKSVKQPKRPPGPSRQNTTVQSSANTPQSKTKRTSSRK